MDFMLTISLRLIRHILLVETKITVFDAFYIQYTFHYYNNCYYGSSCCNSFRVRVSLTASSVAGWYKL